jgi:LmbE family N-acetylglucosaminyl deacetylase
MAKTVIAFTAHPDDAEWYAGGTLAKFANEGARVLLVIATDGRRGSHQHTSEELVRLRAAETIRAAHVLGAEPPVLLGHPDFELDTLPAGVLREQFIRLIRQHQPDVAVTGDYLSFDLHPDHRAVAVAAAEALEFAHLPLLHPEHLAEGLQPHFVAEKYFYADRPTVANKIVDVSATMQKKLWALDEHATQIRFLVEDIVKQAALAGLDARLAMGETADDPMAAIAWALETQAREIGARIGVEFGEAFRYERYHPLIEKLLAAQEK